MTQFIIVLRSANEPQMGCFLTEDKTLKPLSLSNEFNHSCSGSITALLTLTNQKSFLVPLEATRRVMNTRGMWAQMAKTKYCINERHSRTMAFVPPLTFLLRWQEMVVLFCTEWGFEMCSGTSFTCEHASTSRLSAV